VVFGEEDSTLGIQTMILYLIWGVLIGLSFHLALNATKQEVVFSEVLLVILAWPIMILLFVFALINEFFRND
jgi:hypothetical protein